MVCDDLRIILPSVPLCCRSTADDPLAPPSEMPVSEGESLLTLILLARPREGDVSRPSECGPSRKMCTVSVAEETLRRVEFKLKDML